MELDLKKIYLNNKYTFYSKLFYITEMLTIVMKLLFITIKI